MRKTGLVLLTVIAMMALVSVTSQAQSLLTRHVPDAVANGEAQSVGRLPAAQIMRFDVVLALRHAPELENFLQDIYDPASPNYRHYVTVKEFTERFGPSQEDYEALIDFAKANGFQVMGGSRDAMDVKLKGTVASIEKAFHVTMGVYQHPTENRTFHSPDREPTVDLSFQLWHISGLDNYALPRPLYKHGNRQAKPEIQGSCPGGWYCGSDMRAAYYGTGSLDGSGQYVGLLEYYGTDLADLDTYYQNVGQKLNVPITLYSTDGTSVNCYASQGCDDTEQTIDMTQALGMAPNLAGLIMFVGSTDTALLGSMSTYSPLPLNLSSSWYWPGGSPSVDDPYFQKMAAQGQSFFEAAGDYGAWNQGGYYWWPMESAYLICVGGTDLITKGAGGPWSSETAWADGGGGISPDDIPIPSWQQLSGVITKSNKGSTKYRNGPDVSAESNFDFYYCSDQSGCGGGLAGTSFAAPMWAGYLALANQQAVANGVPAPGFINPTIYPLGLGSGYGAAFHDITSGSNGFPAVTGYDLATGWGSPNGSGLINALTGTQSGPGISFSPTSLKWGKVLVGKTGGAKKLTVSNSGSATLDITSIATSGDFALKAFTSKKKCGSTLAAGASCIVKVTFTPTQTGTRTGDLIFTDNASGSPQEVPLSGTGK
jgi:kumamolisin